MRVSVIRSMGTIIHLDVETDATVGILKVLIQERHGIPLEAQYLMFGGPPLVNNHKLVDLNIKENSRLSLLDRRVLHIAQCRRPHEEHRAKGMHSSQFTNHRVWSAAPRGRSNVGGVRRARGFDSVRVQSVSLVPIRVAAANEAAETQPLSSAHSLNCGC